MDAQKDIDWVTQFIAKLEESTDGVLTATIGGVPIVSTFGPEVLLFFKENKILLVRIGKEAFCNFLLLVHQKREEEAFRILLDKMSSEEIIARLNMDAAVLAQYTDDREKFIAATKKWALTSLAPVVIKILLGLII